MRSIIKSYLSLPLSQRAALTIVLTFTTVVIFDSTILKFTSYTSFELPTEWNILIFVTFSIAFSLISSFTISKAALFDGHNLRKGTVKYFHIFIIISQIVTFSIVLTIILQMTLYNAYNIVFLRLENYLAYGTALIFIISLSLTFIRWIRSKRNYIAYLLLISFLLLGTNVIVSFFYLESYYSNPISKNITPYNLITVITAFRVLNFTQNLSLSFDVLSTLSFVFMWISTLILLRQYSLKIGKIRYLIFMIIPLVYYLFPLEGYFGNIFRSFISGSALLPLYIVIFSATTQIGALIFSLTFLMASRLIRNTSVRHYTLISFIGLAMVFGSLEIGTLQYALYPPFGLITQAFLPLGSYLLFIGIVTSSIFVSKDANLRKEFYKKANSQLDLLKAIGVTQMESELMNKYKSVMKFSSSTKGKTDEESDRISLALEEMLKTMDKDDVREILHQVLLDVYSKALDRR